MDSTIINYMSDLHLEFLPDNYNFDKLELNFDAEILILAGDVCTIQHPNLVKFFQYLQDKFQLIVYVPGNHEYYGTSIFEANKYLEKLCSKYKIYFLNNKSVSYRSYTIIGSTLWSNIPIEAEKEIKNYLNDFKLIKDWTPALSTEYFRENVKFLKEQLSLSKESDKIIIVTHHAPLTKGTSAPYFEGKITNCGFASDCGRLMTNKVKVWIYGHTHYSTDFYNKSTRILSNQRGYSEKDSNWSGKKSFHL